jgi:hypothetical protein
MEADNRVIARFAKKPRANDFEPDAADALSRPLRTGSLLVGKATRSFFLTVFDLEEGERPLAIQRIPGHWIYSEGTRSSTSSARKDPASIAQRKRSIMSVCAWRAKRPAWPAALQLALDLAAPTFLTGAAQGFGERSAAGLLLRLARRR